MKITDTDVKHIFLFIMCKMVSAVVIVKHRIFYIW